MITPIKKNSRQVGNVEVIFDTFDSSNPSKYGQGTINNITKKFIILNHNGEVVKFHRSTGLVVGYHWPYDCRQLAPETC